MNKGHIHFSLTLKVKSMYFTLSYLEGEEIFVKSTEWKFFKSSKLKARKFKEVLNSHSNKNKVYQNLKMKLCFKIMDTTKI